MPHTCSHRQGSARDKDKREQERQQLQDLVGKNLTYLSQLDGLGYDLYAGMVRGQAIVDKIWRADMLPCMCPAAAACRMPCCCRSLCVWLLIFPVADVPCCPCSRLLICPAAAACRVLSAAAQVLPRVMEQIVSCKDGIAQQYLMQCVIQVWKSVWKSVDLVYTWSVNRHGKMYVVMS